MALVLVGYAVREKLPEFIFSALLICTTVSLAYVLAAVAVGGPIDSTVVVRVGQLNAITIATHAPGLPALRKRWLLALESKSKEADSLLRLELGSGSGISFLLLTPLTLSLILEGEVGKAARAAGSLVGWWSLGVTTLTVVLIKRSLGERLSGFTSSLDTVGVCVSNCVWLRRC